MVGIVVVSHSAALAEGVVDLARGMAGEDVPIEAAGGLDEPGALGTDAVRVMDAIARAGTAETLVLMDLGSAVLSAETALDLLDDDARAGVLLCEAPLVEGAVAAAAAARAGASLAEVAAEARNGLAGKVAHLGGPAPGPPVAAAGGGGGGEGWEGLDAVVTAAHGLHARPAAAVVRAAADGTAEVRIRNLTTGAGPAPARSLTALSTLGALEGHRVRIEARGPGAADAAAAIAALIGEAAPAVPAGPPASAAPPAPGAELDGVAAGPGRALGPARPVRAAEPAMPDRPSGDPAAEGASLRAALADVAGDLARLRETAAPATAGILDAQGLMLVDEGLVGPAESAVAAGAPAARAWHDAVAGAAAAYEALGDEYLRARAADLRDVGRRVVARLAGTGPGGDAAGEPGVLTADDLGAAEVAELDRDRVVALATAAGGPTSHAAIIARTLGIPAVAGLGPAILAVAPGTPLLVDGDAGVVTVAPGAAAVEAHRARARDDAARDDAARAKGHEPARTRDGHHVEVEANVGAPRDLAEAVASGADGVGLLRTEFLFLDRADPPDEDEQERAYADAVAALGGRRLVLRTLDAGADKPLRYLALPAEANPFLGVRGLRLSLARPDTLRTQLRAALRAAEGGPMGIMFPMVSEIEELRAARRILDEARESLVAEGREPPAVEVGAMVEVPAAALLAEALAAEADFLSIGTNDLVQYTMAAERGNAGVARLSDPVHPAVLGLIARVARAGREGGARVAVCGEAASDPAAVPLLVGLGIDELSVAPRRVPIVKEWIRALDRSAVADLASRALALDGAAAVRRLVMTEAPAT